MLLVSQHRDDAEPLRATYAIATDQSAEVAEGLLEMAFVELGLIIEYARALSTIEIAKLGLETSQSRSIWPPQEL